MKGKGKLLGSTSRDKLAGSTSRERVAARPKPQFSTDFVDREKYRLSESEMIQKKAALQSKHRQQAIEELQERRKKLEMGIIDEDTRKVYETALTSKNIDLNPSLRKNLSQMIQYQRQKQKETGRERPQHQFHQGETGEQEECSEPQDGEEYERELRDAQAFIKKFERAKKMDKIERAVNLLTEPDNKPVPAKPRQKSKEKKPIFQNPCISSNILKQSQTSLNTSTNEEILSNIEDTIRFMEERLFSAGRVDKLKKEHKDKEQSKLDCMAKNTSFSQLPYKCNQSLSTHLHPNPITTNTLSGRNFEQETLEISQLRVKQSSGEEEEDDCLDTIRRMKEMMDPREVRMKENYDFGNKNRRQFEELSTVQKQTPHHADSDAEIDFSLTINHSLASDRPSNIHNEDEEYERIKKSLFEEVSRLQLQGQESSPSPSLFAKTNQYEFIDESSIPLATPSPLHTKKPKKANPELQRLRSQINGTKSSVEAIKVEQGARQGQGEVIGMDFRGSFNIKKNVLSHP